MAFSWRFLSLIRLHAFELLACVIAQPPPTLHYSFESNYAPNRTGPTLLMTGSISFSEGFIGQGIFVPSGSYLTSPSSLPATLLPYGSWSSTVAAWVKTSTIGTVTYWGGSIAYAGTSPVNWGVIPGGNGPGTGSLWCHWWPVTVNPGSSSLAVLVLDNTWHHIAYTFDNASNTLTSYRDCYPVGSATAAYPPSLQPSVFQIGSSTSSENYDNFYFGHIDEVYVWQTALSPERISSLPGCCPYGSFYNRSVGHCAQCPSGSSRNGTLTSCTPCNAGSYSKAGAVSCTICPGGHFCPPGTSSWARLNCGRGNYCPDGSGSPTPCPYQVPPPGGWGQLKVQGPAFLFETAHCLNHCFWNFSSGDGLLSKC